MDISYEFEKNTFINHLFNIINNYFYISHMQNQKAVDLDKEKPFNYTEIIKKTDEFIDMLVSLDIAYPVLSHAIKRNKELKYRYEIIRQRKPQLFYD